jgi:hypothetical protein
MTATVRRAWLQKHVTPAARAGEFHWFPADGDRELRAGLVEQLAGVPGEAVLWRLAPRRAVWARAFVATAPSDGRRYTGLAVAIAEGEAGAAGLLDAIVPSPPVQWSEELEEPAPASEPCTLPDRAVVARALLDGGAAAIGELSRPGLPRAIAAIERRMPFCVAARTRQGAWLAEAAVRAVDRVAELAVAAPGTRAARAWQLACELADGARGVDAVVAAALRAGAGWLRALNAWGRGKLAGEVDALADGVALRALGELLADREPARAIAEARWHALLPRAHRDELLAAVARRAVSLQKVIDA